MRRLIGAGLAGLFALSIMASMGCSDDKKKTEIPDNQVELPKESPVPVGGKGGKGLQPGGPPPSSDQ
jgi:hypothetical protein